MKLLFIRLPKTATTFLNMYFLKTKLIKQLKMLRFDPKMRLNKDKKMGPLGLVHRPIRTETNIEDYYKFGFVRNPWDYQVSFYHFFSGPGVGNRFNTFEEYIKRDDDLRFKMFFKEDDGWLSTRYKFYFCVDDTMIMDHIGKVETLHDDMEYILKTNNIDMPEMSTRDFEEKRGRVNASRRDKDYRTYYTDELAQIVADKDKFIIDKYGYEF